MSIFLSLDPNYLPYQALTLLDYKTHIPILEALSYLTPRQGPLFLGLAELFKISNPHEDYET